MIVYNYTRCIIVYNVNALNDIEIVDKGARRIKYEKRRRNISKPPSYDE